MKLQEGIIAFLDALGTKGIWARSDPEQYTERWDSFLKYWKGYRDTLQEQSRDELKTHYKMKIFSDTIIITMEAEIQAKETLAKETDTLLLEMSRLIGPMILKGIYDGIYLRGAISVGKFYQSDSLIIGPAVDEAAEWYTSTEWIGVSTSPTAHYTIEKLAELNKTDLSKRYIRYNVPTKIGIQENWWVVNWPIWYNDFPDTSLARTLILNRFASNPISVSSVHKFHNTLKFFDQVAT